MFGYASLAGLMAFVCMFCKGEDLAPAFSIRIRIEDVRSALCCSKGSLRPVFCESDAEPHGGYFVTMSDPLHKALRTMEVWSETTLETSEEDDYKTTLETSEEDVSRISRLGPIGVARI